MTATPTLRNGAAAATRPEPARARPASTPGGGHRDIPALTGLRGVAVVAVVAFHLQEGRSSWYGGGWAGVDVFFVLSGYLVTTLVAREAGGPLRTAYGRFLARRAARLLPALAVLLAVVALAALRRPDLVDRTTLGATPVVPGRAVPVLLATVGWELAGVANLLAARGALLTPALGHVWSLDVEWQFYLCWPLLVLGLRPALLRRVTVAVVVAAACYPVVLVHGRPDWVAAYFATATHLVALGAGALVAQLGPSRRPRVTAAVLRGVGWPLLGAIVLLLGDSDGKYRAGSALTALAAAALVTAYVQPGVRAAVLAHPAAVWLGERSYGLYLWHYGLLGVTADRGPVARLLAVVVALALADLSLRCVERPVRSWVRRRQAA